MLVLEHAHNGLLITVTLQLTHFAMLQLRTNNVDLPLVELADTSVLVDRLLSHRSQGVALVTAVARTGSRGRTAYAPLVHRFYRPPLWLDFNPLWKLGQSPTTHDVAGHGANVAGLEVK